MPTDLSPSYLRLHHDDDSQASVDAATKSQEFWNAFSAATGWRVDRSHQDNAVQVIPAESAESDAVARGDQFPAVVRDQAQELASLAAEMSAEIDRLRMLVRDQEIALAAHATTQIAPGTLNSAADHIELTLHRAVNALGFDSAAIYMLDDDTQHLTTRAVVGLPQSRLEDSPRQLRGSRADLEAMVQNTVAIDNLDAADGPTWNAPEKAGSAICTALFRGDLPIGTLWLFSERPQKLGDTNVAIAQLTSEQITLLLTDTARNRRAEKSKSSVNAVRDIAAWQYSSLPVGNRLAPGWFIDGMIESPKDLAIGWHAWDVLPDGSMMFAIAESLQTMADGAMVAATARAALTAHCGYRHQPKELLQRLRDTLWQTNSADQLCSLLYGKIDPDTGEGEVACAGTIGGLIAGPYGYRPLISVGTRPLASSINVDCFHTTFNLSVGETLLGYGAGLEADGIGQDLIGCCLRSATQAKQRPLTVLRRELAAFPNRHERGLLALSRD